MATLLEIEALAAKAGTPATAAVQPHHAAPQRKANNGAIKKMLAASTAPYGTSGKLGERPYEFTRASAWVLGKCEDDDAKEELHYSNVLRKHLRDRYGPAFSTSRDQLVIPLSPDLMRQSIGVTGNDRDLLVMKELEQKMFLDNKNINPSLIKKTVTNTLNDSYGGTLVSPPAFGDLIELQRYSEIFSRLGCRNIPMAPQGSMVFPRISGVVTSYYQGEDPATGASGSRLPTGDLQLTVKTLITIVPVSIQLMVFGSVNVEAEIRNNMALSASQTSDQAFLNGTGGIKPLGLLRYPTQTSFVQGVQKTILYTPSGAATDGDKLYPQDITNMIGALPDMIESSQAGWLLLPQLNAKLQSTRADAITAGDGQGPFVYPITKDPMNPIATLLDGVPIVKSRLIPSTTKGSGTVYPAIVGKWSDWIVARSGIGMLDTNTQGDAYFAYATQALRLLQFHDAGPAQASSFVIAPTVLPTW